MVVFKGKVWKFGDNISTDLMMPGFAVLAGKLTVEEAKKWCMYSNRPGWAEQVRPGDILVAGKNLGCGSSRNPAPILKALGISVVIAESMARIFFRNCINSGLPVLIAPGISAFVDEGNEIEVNIETGEIKNLTKGTTMKAKPLPDFMMEILKEGGIEPYLIKRL